MNFSFEKDVKFLGNVEGLKLPVKSPETLLSEGALYQPAFHQDSIIWLSETTEGVVIRSTYTQAEAIALIAAEIAKIPTGETPYQGIIQNNELPVLLPDGSEIPTGAIFYVTTLGSVLDTVTGTAYDVTDQSYFTWTNQGWVLRTSGLSFSNFITQENLEAAIAEAEARFQQGLQSAVEPLQLGVGNLDLRISNLNTALNEQINSNTATDEGQQIQLDGLQSDLNDSAILYSELENRVTAVEGNTKPWGSRITLQSGSEFFYVIPEGVVLQGFQVVDAELRESHGIDDEGNRVTDLANATQLYFQTIRPNGFENQAVRLWGYSVPVVTTE